MLTEHRDLLDRLAGALLEHETLDAEEIDGMLGLDEGPVGGRKGASGSGRQSGRTTERPSEREPVTAPS